MKRGFGLKRREVYQASLGARRYFSAGDNYGLSHALRISVGTPEENRLAIRVLESLFRSTPVEGGAERGRKRMKAKRS